MAVPLAIGFWAVFTSIVVPLVVRVFVALGVGWVAYQGLDVLLDNIGALIQSTLSGMPPTVVEFLALVNADRATVIILSALSARLVLAGLTAAGLWRVRFTGPGA